MTITSRTAGYQVRVYHQRKRYASQVNGTYAEALEREEEMVRTLRVYGTWPRPKGSPPVLPTEPTAVLRKTKARRVDFASTGGTLAKACAWVEKHGWMGLRYNGVPYLRVIGSWLILEEGVRDLDQINTQTIIRYVGERQRQEMAASTINKELAALDKAFAWALDQTPPLAARKPRWQKAKPERLAKWWLPPQRMEELLAELRTQPDRSDLALFADFVELICKSGLRVEEALRLQVRHVLGGGSLEVPGTKTAGSQAVIAIMARAEEILCGRIASVKPDPEAFLFPFSYGWAAARWSEARGYLGAMDIHTATLKALRRTFAKIATNLGMPTAVLQDILRHRSITTTQGYTTLTGDEAALEVQRKWLAAGDGEQPKGERKR